MNARAAVNTLIGPVDARVPAMFRVALGLVTLVDFAGRLQDAFTFYSTQGLLAPDAPIARRALLDELLFGAQPSPARVVVVFVLYFVAIACFTLGYRTRLSTVMAWAVISAVQMRNRVICDGGDTLLRILLFWAMFVDLGGRLSLDVALGRRPAQAAVPGWPVRLLRLQIALVYLVAGVTKNGSSWMDGSAVYYAVQSIDFGRPFGSWLVAHLPVARAVAFATLAIEISFAPLVLAPVRFGGLRLLGLLLGLALHVGIAATMRVGIFSWVLPASYSIYLLPRWIDAGVRRLRLPALRPLPDAAPAAPAFSARAAVLWAALGLQMAAVVCQLILGKGGGARAPIVYRELALIGIAQAWSMFAPEPPRRLNRFSAAGVLTDGSAIDVLAAAAPKMLPGGVVYSRWYKYRSDLARTDPADLETFGRYLCRRYNGEASGAKLDHFTLTLHWRRIAAPGQYDSPAWQQADVLHQPCLAPP